MLDTTDVRITPPRPDDALPAPPPRRRRRVGLVALATVLVLGGTIYALGHTSGAGSDGAPASVPGHRYESPQLAFDVPAQWHEFYLDVPWQFSAAYGPVEGGDDDYVVVGPVAPETVRLDDEALLATGAPRDSWTGQPASIDVNGLPGLSVPVRMDDIEGRSTLVLGDRGKYLIGCSYGAHMETAVVAGCDSITASFSEMRTPAVAELSGCSDAELTLLDLVPIPAGTGPGSPEGSGTWDTPRGHMCDRMVDMNGQTGDVLASFSASLRSAGWRVMPATKDREMGSLEVWRFIAMKDWDIYMVEAYVDPEGTVVAPGATQNFFITVSDG